jgi:hypothetical protein
VFDLNRFSSLGTVTHRQTTAMVRFNICLFVCLKLWRKQRRNESSHRRAAQTHGGCNPCVCRYFGRRSGAVRWSIMQATWQLQQRDVTAVSLLLRIGRNLRPALHTHCLVVHLPLFVTVMFHLAYNSRKYLLSLSMTSFTKLGDAFE